MPRRSKRAAEKADADKAPKPAKIPDKLARPFEQAIKSIVDANKAAAEAEKASAKGPASASAKGPASASAKGPASASRTARAAKDAKRTADPVAQYGYDDRAAFHQAFADVRPLPKAKAPRRSGQTGPISAEERRERELMAARMDEAEQAARARLDALVAGSVKFVVERDDDNVYGRRSDVPDRVIDGLLGRSAAPVVKIDLHGLDARAAATEISTRLRDEAKRGTFDALIVTGKGLHSEGGTSVLRDVAISALTTSAAAPLVVAFATAPLRFGGSGAILVRVERR